MIVLVSCCIVSYYSSLQFNHDNILDTNTYYYDSTPIILNFVLVYADYYSS